LQRVSPIIRGLGRFYHSILARTIRSPYAALIVAGIFIVIGLVTVPFLNVSLLPTLSQTDLLIQMDAAPGTSRSEMNRIMAQASSELRAIPGVSNIGSHVGRAITGDAIVGINSGELWINLDSAADYDATVATIQEVVDGYPGLERSVQNYQPARIGQALTGPDKDLVVRIYGHELEVLANKAQEVRQAIAGVNGVVDAEAILYAEEPQVEIEVDLASAEAHGLKPGDIRRQATTLLSGIHVGNLYEEQKVFDVLVWGLPELRANLTSIDELLIDTPDGSQVALGDLAEVRIAPAATVIERDAVSRYVDVVANVSGRSVDAVTTDIESSLAGVQIPFEYHIEILKDSQGLQANQGFLIALFVAATIGIYLVIQAGVDSWRLAFVLFVTAPMAVVGGLVAALIGGGLLSIGALFGLLTVLTIAVRNGLVMIDQFRHLDHQEDKAIDVELLLSGARERLGPILLTAFATAAAFLPILIAGSSPGVELLSPMAAVILGGLVTSTLLNLFIVPALYLRWPSAVAADAPSVEESSTQPTLEAAD
jgi:Cu/Ag efflux pump CusA